MADECECEIPEVEVPTCLGDLNVIFEPPVRVDVARSMMKYQAAVAKKPTADAPALVLLRIEVRDGLAVAIFDRGPGADPAGPPEDDDDDD